MISGTLYINDIRYVMQSAGSLSVAEIKAKLLAKDIKLDDTQILDGLDVLIRRKMVRRSSEAGKFIKVVIL